MESKRISMSNEGVLNAMYTKTDFVKIKAAYSIEKVCFSFVKIGKKGEGFDVFVDLDEFASWMEDVVDNTLGRVISSEKQAGEKYPKAYKFITGITGEKSVGFGVSPNAFCVIHGESTKDGKKVYANIPVSRNFMKTLARYYFGTVSKKMDELYSMTLKGSESFHSSLTQADAEYEEQKVSLKPNVISETKEAPAQAETKKEEEKLNIKTFAKAGDVLKSTDKNGKAYYSLPVRVQNRNGSFSSKVKKLIIFVNDFNVENGTYNNVSAIIEMAPDKVGPFKVSCDEAGDMFKLNSVIEKPSVK